MHKTQKPPTGGRPARGMEGGATTVEDTTTGACSNQPDESKRTTTRDDSDTAVFTGTGRKIHPDGRVEHVEITFICKRGEEPAWVLEMIGEGRR